MPFKPFSCSLLEIMAPCFYNLWLVSTTKTLNRNCFKHDEHIDDSNLVTRKQIKPLQYNVTISSHYSLNRSTKIQTSILGNIQHMVRKLSTIIYHIIDLPINFIVTVWWFLSCPFQNTLGFGTLLELSVPT